MPAAPEVVASEGYCTTLRPGERLWSVSAEGQAWLVAADGGVSSLRVLDPFAPDSEVIEELELADLAQLQAWSGTDAAIIADGGLWRVEELARIQITVPTGFASPAELCGDPGTNGFLLAGGKLFERRAEEWWVWDPGTTGDAAPHSFLRFEGECQSTDNLTWLTSPDGTLWRIEPSRVSRPVRFEALRDAAATKNMLAILEDDRLWIGPEAWQPWIFPGPTPKGVSAAGDLVWMASGQQLLRFDGESFVEVSHLLEEPIVGVAAHPGGAWVFGHDNICHQATAPMVRVAGVRSYARSIEFDYPFEVLPSAASMSVTATLDEQPIELALDSESGWLTGRARLETVGWHQLKLDVQGDGAAGSRSLLIKRLPEVERSWATDVGAIYQQNCTGAECHGSAPAAPDLSTYEAWLGLADKIRARVVEARTMPPPASQSVDWGDEQIDIISQWIEGGMLP